MELLDAPCEDVGGLVLTIGGNKLSAVDEMPVVSVCMIGRRRSVFLHQLLLPTRAGVPSLFSGKHLRCITSS